MRRSARRAANDYALPRTQICGGVQHDDTLGESWVRFLVLVWSARENKTNITNTIIAQSRAAKRWPDVGECGKIADIRGSRDAGTPVRFENALQSLCLMRSYLSEPPISFPYCMLPTRAHKESASIGPGEIKHQG